MRKTQAFLILLALLSATLVAAALGACERRPRGPGRVTILYTGGVHGALEPCGCSPGQLGGIGRMATLIKRVRKEPDAVVLVDAGDLLFQDVDALESLRPQLILKAKSMQKAYGAMHAAVLNLGGKDVAAGTDLAVAGARAIGAEPISSNLTGVGGKAIAPASTVIDAGGVRIAFVGVMDPASLPGANKGALRAAPPLDRIRAAVQRVTSRADVVVLLSTLGLDADREIAAKVPGLDLVIDAGELPEPRNIVIPQRAGGAYLVAVKPLGEFVGRVDIALGAGHAKGLRDATTSDRIEGMPSDGAKTGPIFGGGLDLRGLSRQPPKASGQLPPLAPGTFRHRVYALGDRLQKDAAMQQVLVAYKGEVAALMRRAPVTRARIPTTGARYLGEETCTACHKAIYNFVGTTLHAAAYATLERVNSAYDLECVGCHVTGWQQPGGFDQPGAVGNLKNVQCEVCHGPGSEHVAAGGRRGVGRVTAQVPMGLCQSCHTPVHSTRFAGKQQLYMDRIRCSQALPRSASKGAPPAGAGAQGAVFDTPPGLH